MGRFLVFSIVCFFFGCNTLDNKDLFQNAAVVTAHPLATQEGIRILKAGGNAIDAAVAVQAVLAVVYPSAGNLGGGGFLVYKENGSQVQSLDFREVAPSAATEDMYLDSNNAVIEKLSTHGIASSGVPGTIAGMWEMHRKYGELEWDDLFETAIQYAQFGFALTEKEAEKLNAIQEDLKQYNTVLPRQFIKSHWAPGDSLFQYELAQTLQRISEKGPLDFYKGQTADFILDCMQNQGGKISKDDLAHYDPVWRNPICVKYNDYEVFSMAPPSSGGIVLGQLLKIIEPYSESFDQHNSSDYMHLLVEAERRAYADRAEYLGDPDFVTVPTKKLLNAKHIKVMWSNFDANSATPSADVFKLFQAVEHEQTTHFSIVDADGNAVAITTTLNGAFGSKVVVPGAGFFLNNEMDDFSIKPGYPNSYGVTGNVANKIEPRKRMLSSMSPTIVLKNGSLFMVLGSPGGSTIITSVLQTFLNVAHFEMTMQQAVDTARFHAQGIPEIVYLEQHSWYDATELEDLVQLGHKLEKRSDIGRVDAILVLPNGLQIGADHRGDDFGNGY